MLSARRRTLTCQLSRATARVRDGAPRSWQRFNKRLRAGARPEHAALHLDHLQRRQMIVVVRRGATIFEQKALKAAVVRLAHRRVHADVCRDTSKDKIVDAARAHHECEMGRAERAFTRLVDDRLSGQRLQFVDDIPTRLATHKDASAWSLVADAGADSLRAPALVVGK